MRTPNTAPEHLQTMVRVLLTSEIALSIFGIVLAFFDRRLLPEELQAYYRSVAHQPLALSDVFWLYVYLSFAILCVVSWVALWRWARCSRLLYLLTCVIGIALSLFSGPSTGSALSSTLSNILTLISGIMLGILFFSDVRFHYETQNA